MELLNQNDSRLKQACEPFDFDKGYTLEDGTVLTGSQLFIFLRDTMCKNRGLGLSACQIGIMTRAFVIGDPGKESSVMAFFNPKILNVGEEVYYEEGCLSYPGLFIKVKRPSHVRVRYTNRFGETDTINMSGLTARVFLHEYDHLDGITFTSKASLFHREKAYRDKKKLDRKRKKSA